MQIIFVNDTDLPAAMQEVRAFFGSAKTLALLGMVAVLVGATGPFGTYDHFAPLERHLYWALIVVITAPLGHLSGLVVRHWTRSLTWHPVARLSIVSAVSAVPVSLFVILVSATFGGAPNLHLLVQLYGQCAAVLFGVFALFDAAAPSPEASPVQGIPDIVARLPGSKRGKLVRLEAQDHYVVVVTDRGRGLLPMRFRDAIAAAMPEPGVQLHRSHWVALGAVDQRVTRDGKPCIITTDGATLPIGRTFRAQTKKAGLT